jgi:hypothetical protein
MVMGGLSRLINMPVDYFKEFVSERFAGRDKVVDFLDELLHRSTKTAMSCDLSVEATRGKL